MLIQARGRRVSTPKCALLLRCRDDESGARLGITVSKRVGNAVVRSRVKRLVREAFRATRELWPPDLDLVVIGRRSAAKASLQDIVDEWLAAKPELERKLQQARKDRDSRKSAGTEPKESG